MTLITFYLSLRMSSSFSVLYYALNILVRHTTTLQAHMTSENSGWGLIVQFIAGDLASLLLKQ